MKNGTPETIARFWSLIYPASSPVIATISTNLRFLQLKGIQIVQISSISKEVEGEITNDREVMKKERMDIIIETFTDYIEHYYDEDSDPVDVSGIVEEHFEEFAEWACDDFVIDEEERDALLDSKESDLRIKIKQIIVREFLLILNS